MELKDNLELIMDYYELTMANGMLESNIGNEVVYFDMFFRKVPDDGGFAIMAGIKQLIDYLNNLSFSDEDIEYLRSKNVFSENFLDYLKNFKFCCDVWAVPEGTPVFPEEPIITVKGPIIQAQLIETMLLLTINHQTLIATKANRVVRAANGRSVSEFGSRRAQGYAAALYGARAAYIGGCGSTACTRAEIEFGIPAVGTMAHSWVQMFDSELDAFRAYAIRYPKNCTLLVDTYNTIKSGLPNAIKVFKEEILPRGYRPYGIRIDSGDATYLSKKARQILDGEGFEDCKIIISNSLDEYKIRDMLSYGAKIDSFGVGERLITSYTSPILGGVYKLCAIEKEGNIIPKIKISDNITKINNPGFKNVWRIEDKETGKYVADIITFFDEKIDESKPYMIFDPQSTWKKKTLTNFKAKCIRKKIFENGKLCYNSPDVHEIQKYCKEQVSKLWDEVKRFENPHKYYVDLSERLWEEKQKLLSQREF